VSVEATGKNRQKKLFRPAFWGKNTNLKEEHRAEKSREAGVRVKTGRESRLTKKNKGRNIFWEKKSRRPSGTEKGGKGNKKRGWQVKQNQCGMSLKTPMGVGRIEGVRRTMQKKKG